MWEDGRRGVEAIEEGSGDSKYGEKDGGKSDGRIETLLEDMHYFWVHLDDDMEALMIGSKIVLVQSDSDNHPVVVEVSASHCVD